MNRLAPSRIPAALIVAPEGKTNKVLVRQLMLLFNYRYGLDLVVCNSFLEGFSAVQRNESRLVAAAAVLDRPTDSRTSLSSLNLEGKLPLFVVVPEAYREQHEELCSRLDDVWFITWEEAPRADVSGSLRNMVERVFTEREVGELFSEEVMALSFDEMQERVSQRLRTIKTLPTLPEVALRIMAMVDNPDGNSEDLEAVLTADPAIVHKVLQIVNSPLFAGSGHKGGMSLNDAIVRLGRRQVGAIAQQIKLMNSLVKPDESLFNLRRFWEHSVASALIAARLYEGKLLPLEEELQFNDYWIGALLHDAGKLVLGFFFWDHFEELIQHMDAAGCTFREAERATGDVANHEMIGRLLMLKSSVGEQLVEAVGTHHTVGSKPSDLVCLLHMANELSKELGFGYLPEEKCLYATEALSKLKLDADGVVALRDKLGADLPDEIRTLVDRCTAPA